MLNKRLLSLVPNIRRYIADIVFFKWLCLLCGIFSTVTLCLFINHCYIHKGTDFKSVFLTVFAVLAAAAVRSIFTEKSILTSTELTQRAKLILRSKIFSHLAEMGKSYNHLVPTAEAVQVSVEGVDQLESYFGAYLPQLFFSVTAPVTLFAVILFLNIKAAIVLLICVPLIPLSIVAVQKFAKKLLSKYWNSYTQLGDGFLENIQGLTTLKIYEADERKHKEMDMQSELFRKATMRVLIMQLNSISVMDIVAYGGAAAGIAVMLYSMANNTVSLLQGMIIILLSAEFFIPMRQLGSFFHIAMNGAAAADKIFKILDTDIPEKGTDIISDDTSVKIDGLSFSYDGKKQVINGISISTAQKGLYSFVGKSGCGKSTIAALLTGKLRDFQGNIYIGGISVKNISEDSLMSAITLINHNSYIFKGTVESNVRMGNKNASDEEVRAALRAANLTELDIKLEISEQGSNLSGGQRQRLALARAIVHDSPIYIFDEATSNIDAESEEAIINTVYTLAEKKLVILISHRLANVVNSDKIFVMKDGFIEEYGTHKELIDNNMLYAQLYNSQMSFENFGKGVFDNEK